MSVFAGPSKKCDLDIQNEGGRGGRKGAILNKTISDEGVPVLKIYFGPPTAESKNLKNHVNFDVGDLFFRSPALWSSQNVFGPPTAGRVVVDFKDRAVNGVMNIQCDTIK